MNGAIVLVALLVIALIIIITLCIALHEKMTNATCLSRRRLEGKTVLVTGGTAGMGLHIATDLAHRGARVIIACPFEDEGIKAREQIKQETGNDNVIFKLLDLGSLHSVREFAEEILKTETRLDVLINNAGVGAPTDRRTDDGMFYIMQVNFYGSFLLTMLLLPLLKKTGKPGEPTRILVTTSVLHWLGYRIALQMSNPLPWFPLLFKVLLYSSSKLYLLYFVSELSKRLKDSNVVVNSVDPGAVGTMIFNSINKVLGTILALIFCLMFKTPWEGAQTAIYAALDKKGVEVSGAYFKNCEIKVKVKRPFGDKIAKIIWEESVKVTKLSDKELEECFKKT